MGNPQSWGATPSTQDGIVGFPGLCKVTLVSSLEWQVPVPVQVHAILLALGALVLFLCIARTSVGSVEQALLALLANKHSVSIIMGPSITADCGQKYHGRDIQKSGWFA